MVQHGGLLSKTLFVSDLDGTLLSSGKELPDGQIATLNHLIDGGLQFTVATARSIQAVNALLKDVHLYLPAITLEGSLVTRPDSLEHLLVRVLSQRASEELLSRLYHREILPFVAAIDDHQDWGFYSHTTSPAAQWYVDEKRAYGDPRLCWYNHPSDVLGTNILSITAFVEQGELNELTNDLRQVENTRVDETPIRHFPAGMKLPCRTPRLTKEKQLAVFAGYGTPRGIVSLYSVTTSTIFQCSRQPIMRLQCRTPLPKCWLKPIRLSRVTTPGL